MTLEELKKLKMTVSRSITAPVEEIIPNEMLEAFINNTSYNFEGDNIMRALKAYCFVNLDLDEVLEYMSDIKVKIEK